MKKPRVWNAEAAIYSALRRAYRSAPAVNFCLNRSKEVYFITSKNGKQLRRVRFKCVQCANCLSRKNVFVDHILPVVDPLDGNKLPDGSRNWIKQIARLFVSEKDLQILCKICHNAKSKQENAIRRAQRKLKGT